MSRKIASALCSFLSLAFGLALWSQTGTAPAPEILQRVLASNEVFVKAHGPDYFKPFIEGQHPQMTLVMCSDSRVQMQAFDATPDGEVFVIRNIGNQIATCEGSVEYGVHHLHTPVLMIVGHVRCGAIKAALGDFSREPRRIRREIKTLKVKKGGDWQEGVEANLRAQVKEALAKFGKEVKEGKLTVVGAVYDFADDLKQGSGRLTLLSINGEAVPSKAETFLPTQEP